MDSKKPSHENTISRRDFHRLALGAVGATVATATPVFDALADHHEAAEGAAPELVTDVESNSLLLGQVKYVNASATEGQQCGNCALLIAREGEYGKCGLFVQGKVSAGGWCTSWVQKRNV